MRIVRAALLSAVLLAVGALLVSGGSGSEPRTPPALPGLPAPFLGTAVSGDGRLTAAVDAYGDVVDLRPGPAGAALIDNPSDRQAAGTVPAATGIVPRLRIGRGAAMPMWRADSVRQHYLPGTSVVRTVARFGEGHVVMTAAAAGDFLALRMRGATPSLGAIGTRPRATPSVGVDLASGVRCARERGPRELDLLCSSGGAVPAGPPAAGAGRVAAACAQLIRAAAEEARRWFGLAPGSRPRQADAPGSRPRSMSPRPSSDAPSSEASGSKVLRSARAKPRRAGGRAGAPPRGAGGAGRRASGGGGSGPRPRDAGPSGLPPSGARASGSRPLDAGAPPWARALYRRSLLTIRALTSRATGAVAAGARDGWAYVWPRDAASAALALAASGHRAEARRVARFLTGLDLHAAARFDEAGAPVPGRAAQGDALGWVDAAARATGVPAPAGPFAWRDRSDYQESAPGTYLGNALAATATHVDGPKSPAWLDFSAHQRRDAEEGARISHEFGTQDGLVREAGNQEAGLDSAAAWAVRPFRLRALYPAATRTLLRLVDQGTRYGITPGEGWAGGADPWTAPTAWSAWALAALAADHRRRPHDRPRRVGRGMRERQANLPATGQSGVPARRSLHQAALDLLADLRRAATPAGDLPERVGVHTGVPTSTTPLLWSSAFAVLALQELWP